MEPRNNYMLLYNYGIRAFHNYDTYHVLYIHLYTIHILTGKRSATLTDEFSPAITKEEDNVADTTSANEAPIPFEWEEHGPRLRRQTQRCSSDEVQNVLFVFDSSGGIGSANYQRMKNAVGKLVLLFCKQVQFALYNG